MNDPLRQNRVFRTSHADVAAIDTGGEGNPIVFLHGNSLCKEVFAPQIEALRDRYRVIALDLPGHGDSGNASVPSRTYTVAGYADCVCEVLAAAGIARAVISGWSLGGNIGLEMTERFAGMAGLFVSNCAAPECIAGPSLAGFLPHPAAAIAGKREISFSEAEAFATFASDGKAMQQPWWIDAVVRADGLARQTVVEALFSGPPRRQRDLAEKYRGPLAMIISSDDPFVDGDYVKSLNYRSLWSGAVQVFRGCGHAPHIHAADQFNTLLSAFVDAAFHHQAAKPS